MSNENVAPKQPLKDQSLNDKMRQNLKKMPLQELKELLGRQDKLLEKEDVKNSEDNEATIRHFRGLVVDEIEMREHARDLEKMVNNLCIDPYIQLAANYWNDKEKQIKETQKMKFKPYATLKPASSKENSNNKEACDNEKGKGIKVLDVTESLALLEAAKKKELQTFNPVYLATLRQKRAEERKDFDYCLDATGVELAMAYLEESDSDQD